MTTVDIRPTYYKLDGKNPVPCQEVREWSRWFETAERVVKQEDVGPFFVSTVFLGIDHRFGGGGQPLVFESAVFTRETVQLWGKTRPGLCDYAMERTATWDEALEAHARAVAWAKEHAT